MFHIKKSLEGNDELRTELQRLLEQFKSDAEKAHWRAIQREFPGITREEYENELKLSFEEIKKNFYSEKGYLKPRLLTRRANGI